MEEEERNRLWIGNLDEKITDNTLHNNFTYFYGYQLLKLLQKHGEIEKFDLLYHRSGPFAGKSRGYGFVSYKNRDDAERAMNQLSGRFMLSKHIVVKWAQSENKEEEENAKLKPLLELSVLSGPKENPNPQNQNSKIRAIEKKLKMMEQKSDLEDFLFEPAIKKPKVLKNKPEVTNLCTKKSY